MIYPAFPPTDEAKLKLSFYNQQPLPTTSSRNHQVVTIINEDELYVERSRLNYRREQLKKKNQTYTESVIIDTYCYARMGRRINYDVISYYCYDTSLSCCDNCLIWFYFSCLCPMRCCSYMIFSIIRWICVPICQNCIFLNDCCLLVFDRVKNACQQLMLCICELWYEICVYICMPCAYFLSGLRCIWRSIGYSFEFCWNGIINCKVWDCIGNCTTEFATKLWECGGAIMNILDCLFEKGLYVCFDCINNSLDVVLSMLQGWGQVFCDLFCNILVLCCPN